jgi:hypothetical protein
MDKWFIQAKFAPGKKPGHGDAGASTTGCPVQHPCPGQRVVPVDFSGRDGHGIDPPDATRIISVTGSDMGIMPVSRSTVATEMVLAPDMAGNCLLFPSPDSCSLHQYDFQPMDILGTII